MSIKVESTSIDQSAAPSGPAASAKPAETPSASVAEAAGQNESEESDTPETEEEESETEAEASDDAEAKDSESDKPKKKSGSQRRKERAERAEAEVARLQKLMEQMALKGAGDSKAEPKVEPKPAAGAGKPHPDDFATHVDYVEALTDWKTDQKLNERDQKSQKQALEIEQAKAIEAHHSRVKAFSEKTKDFQDVLEGVDDLPVSPTVEGMLLSSENGPEIMYELAKNRAEFERINKLAPFAAVRALTLIEAKLAPQSSDEKKPEQKKTTKAPKPIDPVGGKAGSGEKSIFDPNISQADYEKLRAKQRSA